MLYFASPSLHFYPIRDVLGNLPVSLLSSFLVNVFTLTSLNLLSFFPSSCLPLPTRPRPFLLLLPLSCTPASCCCFPCSCRLLVLIRRTDACMSTRMTITKPMKRTFDDHLLYALFGGNMSLPGHGDVHYPRRRMAPGVPQHEFLLNLWTWHSQELLHREILRLLLWNVFHDFDNVL